MRNLRHEKAHLAWPVVAVLLLFDGERECDGGEEADPDEPEDTAVTWLLLPDDPDPPLLLGLLPLKRLLLLLLLLLWVCLRDMIDLRIARWLSSVA